MPQPAQQQAVLDADYWSVSAPPPRPLADSDAGSQVLLGTKTHQTMVVGSWLSPPRQHGNIAMARVDDTTARIHDFVTRKFPLALAREIGVDDSLLDGGIIDSMGTLDVIQFLEADFGIEVTDEDLVADHFDSVARMARLVRSKNTSSGVGAL